MRFLVLFFSLLSFTLFGQQKPGLNFSGIISDAATNQPLPGASVYFSDARIGVTTNAEGRFLIRNIPAGHHLIEISHTGYTTIVDHLDFSSSIEKNYSLSTFVVENQGVTVTGVTTATSTRTATIPVTIMRKSQLLHVPSTNIIDALSRQPGVSQISTGPAISKPVIRGLSYNRVVVINDGVRQEGQQWGDEHGIELDEYNIERVEILKGPASIMYGSDALAGVINFVSSQPVTEGAVKGNFYSSYQTNNNQSGLHADLSGNLDGFNWSAYVTSKSAKDYRNKYDGRVLNSRFNERNYGGYFGINKSWGFSHIIFSRFHQNTGLVEGERDDLSGRFMVNSESPLEHIATEEELNSRDLLFPYQKIKHYKLASDNSFRVGQSRVKINLAWQQNLRNEYGNPLEPAERELAFDLQTLSYNLQWRFPEKGSWHTTVGLNGMQQSNQNKGEEVIIPEYDFFDLGLFLYSQKTLKNFTLSGGLRFDNRHINSKGLEIDAETKFNPLEKNFSTVTGSAGLSYHPSQTLTLKTNIARGFRAPTLSELASNGAHEGTNRYEYGSPGLDSEKSFQFDVGLDVDVEHFSFSLSGFYNRISDFIFYRRLLNSAGADSIVVEDGEELKAFQYNSQDAVLSGLEASFDFHPHPLDWLHFENSISLVRGRFDQKIDGTDNLPMIPAGRWISELRANFAKPTNSLRNLYLSVEMEKTFEQNKPFYGYNTETATPGYSLLNTGFGMEVFMSGKQFFSFHFAANNLTNEAYQSHLNRLKYTDVNNATGRRGVFNMGRNFSFKLNIPVDFKKAE